MTRVLSTTLVFLLAYDVATQSILPPLKTGPTKSDELSQLTNGKSKSKKIYASGRTINGKSYH